MLNIGLKKTISFGVVFFLEQAQKNYPTHGV